MMVTRTTECTLDFLLGEAEKAGSIYAKVKWEDALTSHEHASSIDGVLNSRPMFEWTAYENWPSSLNFPDKFVEDGMRFAGFPNIHSELIRTRRGWKATVLAFYRSFSIEWDRLRDEYVDHTAKGGE